MTMPRRLSEEGTDFERRVLASARVDAGSSQGLMRTLAAASAMASAGTATTAAIARGAAGASAKWSGAFVVLKWIGLGLVVGAGATDGARLFEQVGPASTRVALPVSLSAVASRGAQVALPHDVPAEIPPETPPTVRARPLALPVSASSEFSLRPHSHVSLPSAPQPAPMPDGPSHAMVPDPSNPRAPEQATPLRAEIDALAAARAALGASNSGAALELLASYSRAFPNGALAEEASVLRIDAYLLGGNHVAAAALARHFLAANPSSPHASRLRGVAGTQNP